MNDVPDMMVFSRRACEASPTYGPMGFNSVIWRRTLMSAFRDPSMCVFIAKNKNGVCGLLVGMSMPMPWSGGFCASDLVFAAEQHGDKLLDLFVKWCDARKIRRIDMGVSDTGREESKDKLFARAGFSTAGSVHYRISEVQK